MRAMTGGLALTLSIVLVAACGGGTSNSSGFPTALPGTAWTVTSINDAPQVDTKPTITFAEDGSVSGTTGCNQYNGTYTIDDKKISFSPLASTKVACPDARTSQQESIFLETVQGATNWAIDADALSLTGDKNLVGELGT